jgi:uncharacterized protein YxeA
MYILRSLGNFGMWIMHTFISLLTKNLPGSDGEMKKINFNNKNYHLNLNNNEKKNEKKNEEFSFQGKNYELTGFLGQNFNLLYYWYQV